MTDKRRCTFPVRSGYKSPEKGAGGQVVLSESGQGFSWQPFALHCKRLRTRLLIFLITNMPLLYLTI